MRRKKDWLTWLAFLLGAFLVVRGMTLLTWDDVKTTDMPVDPKERATESVTSQDKERSYTHPTVRKISLSLQELTQEPSNPSCSSNKFVFRRNIIRRFSDSRRIPNIIHQTSKSRCLTPAIYNATTNWELEGWSYYFHDDDAVERLLLSHFPEFPHLSKVVRNCMFSGTLKADLWRYVILWVYGGVYSDLDAVPNEFTADTIVPSDDGFFVVELYHLLSQYFMAVSPRHPLMYYAIQHCLINLLRAEDTMKHYAPAVTGPSVLHTAFINFQSDVGIRVDERPHTNSKPQLWNGTFVGTQNRSIRVVGEAQHSNQYVIREALVRGKKMMEYQKMGMKHFYDFTKKSVRSNVTCLAALLRSEPVEGPAT